jgi:hypothetical protein
MKLSKNDKHLDLSTHWDLSNRGFKSVQFPRIAARLPLQSLDLSHNALTSFPSTVLHLPSLKSVNVSHNKIHELSESDVERLRQFQRPIEVDLCYNSLSTVPPEMYALHHVSANTAHNPFVSGLFYPAWCFGVQYDRYKR